MELYLQGHDNSMPVYQIIILPCGIAMSGCAIAILGYSIQR